MNSGTAGTVARIRPIPTGTKPDDDSTRFFRSQRSTARLNEEDPCGRNSAGPAPVSRNAIQAARQKPCRDKLPRAAVVIDNQFRADQQGGS